MTTNNKETIPYIILRWGDTTLGGVIGEQEAMYTH